MRLHLAIEGGATRTRAGLYDADRSLLAETETGPCNPVACGMEAALKLLGSLAKGFLNAHADASFTIAGGISGAARPSFRGEIAESLWRLGAERVLVTDDLRPVLFANAATTPAILVVAGTGSSVLAQTKAGEIVLLGGRGAVFSDEGSAYQIAVSGLRAAAHALDGIGPETALTRTLPVAARLRDFADFSAWSATALKHQVAALAKVVTTAAVSGDAVAARCVRDQATMLAELVSTALRRFSFPTESPVFLAGGLFEHCELYRKEFESALHARHAGLAPRLAPLRGHRAVAELCVAKTVLPGVSCAP
ncbi:MAG: hypothetical protein HY706_07885 [Candidatus Hydrogenedentes bacterium]|nr:hypothetical protein [Candidatus Hydrogenedentota bacterium]